MGSKVFNYHVHAKLKVLNSIVSQNNSCHKDKSGLPPQIDLTDVEDSNSWLIGGTGSSRVHHQHAGETAITEGSWTTPAEPTWIPEEIVSREDGKNFASR